MQYSMAGNDRCAILKKIADAFIKQKGRNYYEFKSIGSVLCFCACNCYKGNSAFLLYMTNEKEARESQRMGCSYRKLFQRKAGTTRAAGDTLHFKDWCQHIVGQTAVTPGDAGKRWECNRMGSGARQNKAEEAIFRRGMQQKKKNTLVVFSVLKVIELIHEDYPNLDISNEGESDFIVEYVKSRENRCG